MTSGEEDIGGDDDYFGCSYKTVIHRPTPNFYIPTPDNLTQDTSPTTATPPPLPPPQQLLPQPPLVPVPVPLPPTQPILLTPSPLIPAPAIPMVMIPSPQVNSPIHYRAHTETDLLYYQHHQQPIYHGGNWYPSVSPMFMYGPPPHIPPPAPPFVMHPTNYRSSSADCRRTANNVNEPHVPPPERVW